MVLGTSCKFRTFGKGREGLQSWDAFGLVLVFSVRSKKLFDPPTQYPPAWTPGIGISEWYNKATLALGILCVLPPIHPERRKNAPRCLISRHPRCCDQRALSASVPRAPGPIRRGSRAQILRFAVQKRNFSCE